jgi:hypothetical protein
VNPKWRAEADATLRAFWGADAAWAFHQENRTQGEAIFTFDVEEARSRIHAALSPDGVIRRVRPLPDTRKAQGKWSTSRSSATASPTNGGNMTKPTKDLSKEKPKKNFRPSSNRATGRPPVQAGHYSSDPSEDWAEAIADGAHIARLALESEKSKPK